jgi:parvulin-like peptidyl-prolyl isomerase
LSHKKVFLAALTLLAAHLTVCAQRPQRRPAAPRTKPGAAATPPARTAAPVNLTAQDMTLLVDALDIPPQPMSRLASSAEERKKFAHDIARMLAAAEEAKATGYLARPELKLQTELSRHFAIAQTYFKRQQQTAGATTPEQIVTPAEIDAFLKEPATAAPLAAFLEDYRKNGPGRGAAITAARREDLTKHYARVMVAMRKGVAAGLARERKTQLLIMLQQAQLLAGAYSKDHNARVEVTDAEIDAYIAQHPELSTKAERTKIEEILKRAQAGEDFAALANQFTEDPSGKGNGGDLGWFARGTMVKPFEEAAFALKPGEVSGVVETVFGLHVIKLEGRRPATPGVAEQVRARHILIRYNAAPRSPNSPPMAPRDKARQEVEDEKRNRALDEIVARRRVRVAEDYPVGPEAAAAAQASAQTQTGAGATKKPTPKAPGTKPGAARKRKG